MRKRRVVGRIYGTKYSRKGGEEQIKMEETNCEIICGAPTTLAVKGQMMMMMMRVILLFCFPSYFVKSKMLSLKLHCEKILPKRKNMAQVWKIH